MSTCEMHDTLSHLYAMVKQLTVTTEKIQQEVTDIRKDYNTIVVSHAQLQTQINNFASQVTGQNDIQLRRPPTPESPRSSPRSPPSLLTNDDDCGTEVAWSM